uniref:Uncharacterized protein n=1 Tax=Meloidogyne enterolobii TaxID=390850 RepID=A0A6V7UPM9_MELEN|nr:unnamed protein product [Meloidogyne enterolobii]
MPASSAEAKNCTEAIGKELIQTQHNFVKSCRISLIFMSFDSVRRALLNKITFVYSIFHPKFAPVFFKFSETFVSDLLHHILLILVSFDSAQAALSSELTIKKSYFYPLNCATPPYVFLSSGPISRSTSSPVKMSGTF